MTTLKHFTIIFTLMASSSTLVFAQDESAVIATTENTTAEVVDNKAPSESTIKDENTEISSAIKYACANSGRLRRVEVEFESIGATLPCSVTYHKDSEAPGEVSTLWHATNQVGYCESKAAEFVEKLRSWGWALHTKLSPNCKKRPAFVMLGVKTNQCFSTMLRF